MTRFQTILARLCATSGCTMMHVDSPPGLLDKLDDDGRQTLAEAIGEDNLRVLSEDQEVQIIVPGNASEAESAGHIRMMRAIKALIAVEGSSVMLVTGSGKVSAWVQGSNPAVERLDDDLMAEAFTRRVANTMPA